MVVSGHGVPAAIIASMVKVAFVAQADHALPTQGWGRRSGASGWATL